MIYTEIITSLNADINVETFGKEQPWVRPNPRSSALDIGH